MKNNSIKNQNINLKISQESFINYKKELNEIINEVDNEYSNIFKSLNTKQINLSFLLFSQYKNNIFPSISYNNIICYNNFSFSTKFYYIFNKFKENKSFIFDEKTFILWYFYLFFIFFNDDNNKNHILNRMRYLLFETNKIVCSLYEKKNILVNQAILILDFYLIVLNHYINDSENFSNLSSKAQKIKKIIFFNNYFDLLEKITIASSKLDSKSDFELILKYLKKIINNSLIKNELNILIIVKNNIIQNYINNIFQNIDTVEIEKVLPSYKEYLISFYSHFLLYKYKISDLFYRCIDITRKSFGHLYNFKYYKDLIIKDISLNEVNSNLLYELHEIETKQAKNKKLLSTSYFLFDNKESIISFSNEKLEIDKSIIFFSFKIGKEKTNYDLLPLMFIKYKNKKEKEYEPFLKIYLERKIDNKNEPIKYKLCFDRPKFNNINIINTDVDDFIIDNNNIYYLAVHFNDKKIKVYLFYENFDFKKNSNILTKEIDCKPIKKELNIKFDIGNDENNSFYNGKIGPIIIVRAPQNKDILNKDIDSLIKNIILLKDEYIYFLIIKSDLSKNYNNLIDNYLLKNEEKDKELKIEIKNLFECLLFLNPNILQFLENKIIKIPDEDSNHTINLPIIYDFNTKKYIYSIDNLNISIITYENCEKYFALDNGLNFICLQLESYNQFAKYYLLKSKNNSNIFNKDELEIIIKGIKNSLKKDILLLGKHSQSRYLYDSYKKIIVTLYDCLLNLNKITPIISDVFVELNILKDIYLLILLNQEKTNLKKETKENIDNNEENNTPTPTNSKLFENTSNDQYKIYINAINSYIGISEIILSSQFYNNSQTDNNIQLITKLFNTLLKSQLKFDDIKYNVNIFNIKMFHNVFYKLINFIYLLDSLFIRKENKNNEIIIDNNIKDKYINLLISNFKLLFNILDITNANDDSQEYFHKIFRFVFMNNENNYYIIYSYLDTIYNFKKNKLSLSFNQNEIKYLKRFLREFTKNDRIEQENKKITEIVLIGLIFDYMFSNPNEIIFNNDNFLLNYLKNAEIPRGFFCYIKIILEKYFLLKNINNNYFINDISKQDKMEYVWNLFEVIIAMIKNLSLNKLNYPESDIINYLYEIIDILHEIEEEIEICINYNLDEYTFIYLINWIKFLHIVSLDKELNLLFNDKIYFSLIDNAIKYCYKSTLFHCNIYIDFDIKEKSNNKERKKLISEKFYDIFKESLDKVYNKYKNVENDHKISDIDISILKNLKRIFEKLNIMEFGKNLEINKNLDNLSGTTSVFFISDFLKLLFSDKKYYKKYEKNDSIIEIYNTYKYMEEIILDLADTDKNNKINNIFDYCFCSLYFYNTYRMKKKIDFYINDKSISKKNTLISCLKEVKGALFADSFIIINDLILLNQVNKDFFFKKITNNDFYLKEVFKVIQTNIFKEIELFNRSKDNKNNEMKNQNDIVDDIEKELATIKVKPKRNIPCINAKSEKNKIKISSTFNAENINIINNLKLDNSENNINSINEENDENPIFLGRNTEFINMNKIDFNNVNDSDDEKELPLELKSESYLKNSFDQIDKTYIINIKKELMKITFGLFFEESFFNNKTFEKMKTYYLNEYSQLERDTKLLKFPSKLKNFTNGLEPSFFLKENDVFFISKIFPITHKYFYTFMNKYKIYNESIILLKKNFSPPRINNINNNEEKNKFDCELIKLDKIYFGYIINSIEGGFLYFRESKFKIDENNLEEELNQKIFSLSSLEIVLTDNTKNAKDEAKNILLDKDIYPKENLKSNKTVIIFYSDIEEIVERRFLFLWQGIEIFLKNGKSYIFNMLTLENYNSITKQLKTQNNILFREKDFFPKTSIISESWKNEKLSTFEYLLFINKYGSRSFNDPNQYYVFPWIVTNFDDLIKLNKEEKKLYEFVLKERKKSLDLEKLNQKEKDKEIKNLRNDYLNFRQLCYPVSAQNESNRENKLAKFQDDDEKFPHHHGTHYSTSSYIYYYLMRLEPYTSLLVELQNYSQENPDRMMQDLKDTIKIINSGNDNRELIPELFCKIDFFINTNCVYFGMKKNNHLVDDLNRIWDEGYNNTLSTYVKFIIEHQKLLNSNSISINIVKWIDNVFGVAQLPPDKKRESTFNIFIKSSYEEQVNLHEKLKRYLKKFENNNRKIMKKIANKINLIISFGQTPQKIFFEKHKGRDINERNLDLAEEDPENYGHQTDYLGDDFVLNFMMNFTKKEDTVYPIKLPGIYFEINSQIEKIFILTETSELIIINSNFFCNNKSNRYNFNDFGKYQLPNILLFDKFTANNNIDYYIYNIKYSFSSFSNDTDNFYLYSNQYIKDLEKSNERIIEIDQFKFMSCRHLDNSFKIYILNKNQKLKIYSYLCEDFVMSCKTINNNSFIIGLRNGKLIKAVIEEYEVNTQTNITKFKKEEIKESKYKIIFENYIQGHKGSINVIEIDRKVGVILTAGDDNKLFIRKLYDFELLTSITLKQKFIITTAKISPMNFLYIICYNKNRKQFVIFGYTLSGVKFAESPYSYYSNLDFTKEGNIICLINDNELGIFEGHSLNKLKIEKTNEDYKKYEQVKNCINKAQWIQLDDLYEPDNVISKDRKIISYLTIEKLQNGKGIYNFKTLKISNISFFE